MPIGTRRIRHFNKGYVCMYVCMVRGDGSHFTFSPNTKVRDTYDE